MSPWTSPKLLLRKSDAALVAAVRDGHETAFDEIVARYRDRLLRYTGGLLRNGQADDAVQQTFLRALQALRTGTEVRELGPWLHRIARNVALNELGSRGGNHVELDAQWEDSRSCEEFEQRATLRAALLAVSALPDRQRIALLRSAAGDPPAAIADRLGVSTVAARQLVHRARVVVRAAVGALMPPPVFWLVRRTATLWRRLPAPTTMPAGVAPVASKLAVVVVVSAAAAAPATIIRGALTGHAHGRAPALAAGFAPRGDDAGTGFSLPARTIEASIASAVAPIAQAEQRATSTPGANGAPAVSNQASAAPTASGSTDASYSEGDQGTGTDPSATDPSATDPSATDPSATDASATDASAANSTSTDPTAPSPTSTDSGSSAPSSTAPSSADTTASATPTTTDTTSAAPTATTPTGTTATPTDTTATTPTP